MNPGPEFNLDTPDDGLVYLASPYSAPTAEVRRARFLAACVAAALMVRRGHLVFSPIAHSHGIAEAGGLPLEWDAWKKLDLFMLRACSRLVVLTIDGWRESKGVAAETSEWEVAGPSGRPVQYADPAVFGLPREPIAAAEGSTGGVSLLPVLMAEYGYWSDQEVSAEHAGILVGATGAISNVVAAAFGIRAKWHPPAPPEFLPAAHEPEEREI